MPGLAFFGFLATFGDRARVAPAILELLGDGVPRTKAIIVEALAGRHSKDDVVRTLIRLAVTGQVSETGGKYVLATAPEP